MRTMKLIIVATIIAAGINLAQACGKERWPVKVGTDKDVMKVSTTIQKTTIADLTRIGAPSNPNIRKDSRYAPTETTVYQITGRLVLIKREKDDDYHLVIQDTRGRTIIVESPAAKCAIHSRFSKEIAAVHKTLNTKYHVRRKKLQPNDPVTVTGIGFFDKKHGQDGVAPNGIELHPLLSVTFKKT